jgi:hypothetical protein
MSLFAHTIRKRVPLAAIIVLSLLLFFFVLSDWHSKSSEEEIPFYEPPSSVHGGDGNDTEQAAISTEIGFPMQSMGNRVIHGLKFLWPSSKQERLTKARALKQRKEYCGGRSNPSTRLIMDFARGISIVIRMVFQFEIKLLMQYNRFNILRSANGQIN